MFANDLMVHSASVFPVRDWQLGCSKVPSSHQTWLKDPHQAIEHLELSSENRWVTPRCNSVNTTTRSCPECGRLSMYLPRLGGHVGPVQNPQGGWPFWSFWVIPVFGTKIWPSGWFPDLWMGWNRGFTALMERLWLTILPSCFDPVSLRVLPLRVSLARYDSNMGDRWPKNESCLESKMRKVFWECRV